MEAARLQVEICNEKKTATRKCSEQIDRAVFCIYLRNRREWFYTVGTVLDFKQDMSERGGHDQVTVYCSQLGRESKAKLCSEQERSDTDGALFKEGVEDTLMLPETWNFRGRGCLELTWQCPDDPSVRKVQMLKTLSCVPIVIIPTKTVPIDYAIFFVSPYHRRAQDVSADVPEEAVEGFVWHAEEEEDDGVEVTFSAGA